MHNFMGIVYTISINHPFIFTFYIIKVTSKVTRGRVRIESKVEITTTPATKLSSYLNFIAKTDVIAATGQEANITTICKILESIAINLNKYITPIDKKGITTNLIKIVIHKYLSFKIVKSTIEDIIIPVIIIDKGVFIFPSKDIGVFMISGI